MGYSLTAVQAQQVLDAIRKDYRVYAPKMCIRDRLNTAQACRSVGARRFLHRDRTGIKNGGGGRRRLHRTGQS